MISILQSAIKSAHIPNEYCNIGILIVNNPLWRNDSHYLWANMEDSMFNWENPTDALANERHSKQYVSGKSF